MSREDELPFWERPELVERFASREPDHRLLDLLNTYPAPGEVRVFDLGCAGGRNTQLLVERGFDVHAVDASRAMVERTRQRVRRVLGSAAARQRVGVGRMEDLRRFPDGSFDLVIALGLYHNAQSREQFDGALAETARVLVPGGLVLVSSFTPRTDLTGGGVHPVPGQPGVYEGFEAGRAFLLEADELDAAMARHGLLPVTPSRTVETATVAGRRVTVNALYRKA